MKRAFRKRLYPVNLPGKAEPLAEFAIALINSLWGRLYLVGCQKSGDAIIFDSLRDVDQYIEIAKENDLTLTAAAETHIHADFLGGVRQLVEGVGGVTAYLSKEGGTDWQYRWAGHHENVRLLNHGDVFSIGHIHITAVHLPGHTPEHLCFLIEDRGGGADEPFALISGDFMFTGDVGRPDLPETAAGEAGTREASAKQLFNSIQTFSGFKEFIEILPGHGAGSSCGKSLGAIPFSSVGYEMRFNRAVRTALDEGEEAFVRMILNGQPEPPMYFSRMKKMNREGVPVYEEIPELPQIDSEEVVKLLASPSGQSVFLDTRKEREAFMKQHLQGALFAPPGLKFSEVAGSYVEPEVQIYLLVEDVHQVQSCMRQLIRIGLDRLCGFALITDVLNDSVCKPCLRSIRVISTAEMKSGSDLILDVRSAGEYAQGHVPGALNVAHTRLVADAQDLPEPQALTVYCGSGLRASLASAVLARMGYSVTFANGKFTDWLEQADDMAEGP